MNKARVNYHLNVLHLYTMSQLAALQMLDNLVITLGGTVPQQVKVDVKQQEVKQKDTIVHQNNYRQSMPEWLRTLIQNDYDYDVFDDTYKVFINNLPPLDSTESKSEYASLKELVLPKSDFFGLYCCPRMIDNMPTRWPRNLLQFAVYDCNIVNRLAVQGMSARFLSATDQTLNHFAPVFRVGDEWYIVDPGRFALFPHKLDSTQNTVNYSAAFVKKLKKEQTGPLFRPVVSARKINTLSNKPMGVYVSPSQQPGQHNVSYQKSGNDLLTGHLYFGKRSPLCVVPYPVLRFVYHSDGYIEVHLHETMNFNDCKLLLTFDDSSFNDETTQGLDESIKRAAAVLAMESHIFKSFSTIVYQHYM